MNIQEIKQAIQQFKQEQLPNATSLYHYEAEIWSGMINFMNWLDTKKEIDRTNDDEIINIVNSILSNGDMIVETINEAVLVKLMELRGTPIKYKKTLRNIDEDYQRWKENNK